MSKGITNSSAPLEDVPLAVGQQKNALHEEKSMSKTNSLRRIFKKSSKHRDSSAASGSKKDIKEGKESDEPKRFHLRMGSGQKHSDSELEDVPSGSSAKLTMKKSIYKYWQTLFKNPKSSHDNLPADETAVGESKLRMEHKNPEDSSSEDELNEEALQNIEKRTESLNISPSNEAVEQMEEHEPSLKIKSKSNILEDRSDVESDHEFTAES